MFDAQEFMNQTMTDSNSTELIPVPENMSGEGYVAVVTGVDVRQWVKKTDPSVSGLALDLVWEIQDEEVKKAVSRDKVTVKQGIMLDITETGQIDMAKGKNVNLGRLREALGLNNPGEPFSFMQLEGQIGSIFVKHRIVGDDVFAEVGRVEKQ